MIGWVYLFAPSSYTLDNVSSQPPTNHPPLSSLRIYHRSLAIDTRLSLFVDDDNVFNEITASINRTLLLFPSGTFLQVKNTHPQDDSSILFFTFQKKDKNFTLGVSLTGLKDIVLLLSGKPPITDETESLLEEIESWFRASLGRPPLDFDGYVTSLSDHNLQWLLQWLLSQRIVSLDMLAAYIWGLDEKGKRLLDNLSPRTRQEVLQIIPSYRRQRSYRWLDEVKYLIHHNLFLHAINLCPKIRILQLYAELRQKQNIEDLGEFLKRSETWHLSLPHLPQGVRERFYHAIPSRTTAAYGSFIDEKLFLSWWENIVSERGLRILLEDRIWWKSQDMEKRASEAMQFLKFWFALEGEEAIKIEDIEGVLSTLSSPWQIELIAQEIGVASCLYALKPLVVQRDLLPPIMAALLEDIRNGSIGFHGWGDHRIIPSQKAFLTAVYVLRRIGRL